MNDDAIGAIITNNATGAITGNDGIQSATGGTVINNGTIAGADGDGIRLSGRQNATVTLGSGSSTSGTDICMELGNAYVCVCHRLHQNITKVQLCLIEYWTDW